MCDTTHNLSIDKGQTLGEVQDIPEVCIEYWKQLTNSQCVGYKYLEHHFLMSPQGIITLGLSSVIGRTPVTLESFLLELGFNFYKFFLRSV